MISSKRFIRSSIIAGVIVTLASAQRCTDQAVFQYFSCDQSCTPAASSISLIRRCTSLVRFGCELRPCGGGYECVGAANKVVQTCANSKIIFQEGDPRQKTFEFIIDLNTPPLAGDYYFLVNARNSMRRFVPGLKESILEFIDSVNGNPNVRFGLGIYRNEFMLDMGYSNLQTLTGNHDAVRNAVRGITTRRANGRPDALLQALVKASTQPFRPNALKAIFAFGDVPGHEPSLVGDGEALDRNSVAYTLRDANISFVGINYRDLGMDGGTTSFGVVPEVRTMGNQASFIAKETAGVLVFRNSVFDAFWRSKTSSDRQFDLDPFTCSEFIDIVPGNTVFPLMITGGKPAVVTMEFRFKNGLCMPFTCEYRITEDDTELQRFTIEVPPRSADSSF